MGKSCSEDALGHLRKVSPDPWVAQNGVGGSYYTASQQLLAKLYSPLEIVTNLTVSDILGRAVIVHDSTAPGRRIACAILGEDGGSSTTTTTTPAVLLLRATNFVKYFK